MLDKHIDKRIILLKFSENSFITVLWKHLGTMWSELLLNINSCYIISYHDVIINCKCGNLREMSHSSCTCTRPRQANSLLKQAKLPTQHFQATLMFFDALLILYRELFRKRLYLLTYSVQTIKISKKLMQSQAHTK